MSGRIFSFIYVIISKRVLKHDTCFFNSLTGFYPRKVHILPSFATSKQSMEML